MNPAKGMPSSVRRRWVRMDRELNTLLDRLQGHDSHILNGQPEAGKWSALQVLHHLLRSEQLALAYLRKKLSGDTDTLPPATLEHRLRSFALTWWLRTPLKVKAPAAVSGEHLPDHSDLAELRQTWHLLRSDFQAFLEEQPKAVFGKAVFRHPFAGRLTLPGMQTFMHEHFRRHRRQALRTVKEMADKAGKTA